MDFCKGSGRSGQTCNGLTLACAATQFSGCGNLHIATCHHPAFSAPSSAIRRTWCQARSLSKWPDDDIMRLISLGGKITCVPTFRIAARGLTLESNLWSVQLVRLTATRAMTWGEADQGCMSLPRALNEGRNLLGGPVSGCWERSCEWNAPFSVLRVVWSLVFLRLFGRVCRMCGPCITHPLRQFEHHT